MILVTYITAGARGQVQREQRRLKGTSFSVGRGTKAQVQLPDGRVKLDHAHILVADTGVTIVADAGEIKAKGRTVKVAALMPGEDVEVGPYLLHVESAPSGVDLALTVTLAKPRISRSRKALLQVFLSLPRLSKRRLSYLLFFTIIIAFLVLPSLPDLEKKMTLPMDGKQRGMMQEMSTLLGGGFSQTWKPGPLSPSHQLFGDSCRTCHQIPFVPVRDAACLDCHKTLKDHVERWKLSGSRGLAFLETRCTECHSEHNGLPIAPRAQERCADCHRDIKSVALQARSENASDFRTGHPQFRLSLLDADHPDVLKRVRQGKPTSPDMVEHSNLKFNHALHLNPAGLRDPEGRRDANGMHDSQGNRTVLKCASCHTPEENGRFMAPVSMEKHCRQCHSLAFEPAVTKRQVPHGNEELVATTLREFYARLALGDTPPDINPPSDMPRVRPGAVLTYEDRQRVLKLAQQKADRVLNELYETRGVCVTCHTVQRIDSAAGWRVAPVKIAKTWLPHAMFRHADHATQSCTSCHDVRDSKRAEDIAMPSINRCRECHVGAQPQLDKVTSECALCHSFHSGHEAWQGAPKGQKRAEAK
jgi:hypothetical protein